jgi:hypothetical protein
MTYDVNALRFAATLVCESCRLKSRRRSTQI